jgi:hypothetical protein
VINAVKLAAECTNIQSPLSCREKERISAVGRFAQLPKQHKERIAKLYRGPSEHDKKQRESDIWAKRIRVAGKPEQVVAKSAVL